MNFWTSCWPTLEIESYFTTNESCVQFYDLSTFKCTFAYISQGALTHKYLSGCGHRSGPLSTTTTIYFVYTQLLL